MSVLRRPRLASVLARGRASVEALRRQGRPVRAEDPNSAAAAVPRPSGAEAGGLDAPGAATPEQLADLRAALARELARLAGGDGAGPGAGPASKGVIPDPRPPAAPTGAATDETAFRYHSHFRNAAPPSL